MSRIKFILIALHTDTEKIGYFMLCM